MATQSPDDRKLLLDERKLALEEQKFAFDKTRERGTAWKSPLLITILTAAAAAGGNAVVSRLNADGQMRVERLKGEQALITEMIKTGGDDAKTAANLSFLVETGLIEDATRRAQLKAYLDRLKTRPDLLPTLPSASPLPASTAQRAALVTPTGACQSRGAKGELCVEQGILLQPNGKPFDVVDATRRTDALKEPPIAVVLHFSAAADGGGKRFFTNPMSPGSAHVEINRDGSITQLVPFDIAANHAGASAWNGHSNLNGSTIGISFANYGPLSGGPGKWRTMTGQILPDDRVVLIAPAAGGPPAGWERYTEAQLRAGEEVLRALVAAYPSIHAVLPHSGVTVPAGRKVDPGPALPLARFAALVPSQ
ncbi:N-acetylmuramoyl-L-alanine amidase [Sphingomonas nostoxanthinifaciens]|uniref:N-acetylmuramoyl-L-alanine amidase n=1 Tax=Sphingomonas nostoxanthinifaciens TaxID=2872652 RepID=UPI001CC1D12F|nr:N-acetylmuramoyl-L-alanine amidase [Sphingomonas nostoxanthinifaciens]UAK24032.1 N-acetylmuramoyl-L-alanine amidase [Sphingomonas nostoxanthinifaciens]